MCAWFAVELPTIARRLYIRQPFPCDNYLHNYCAGSYFVLCCVNTDHNPLDNQCVMVHSVDNGLYWR